LVKKETIRDSVSPNLFEKDESFPFLKIPGHFLPMVSSLIKSLNHPASCNPDHPVWAGALISLSYP
jgi:hypothetical protein